MKTLDINQLKIASIKWVKENPDEALLCLISCFIAAVAFVAAAFFFASRTPETEAPPPLAAASKWTFSARVQAGGGQVCDLYKRHELTQARCYGRDPDGVWRLKAVF